MTILNLKKIIRGYRPNLRVFVTVTPRFSGYQVIFMSLRGVYAGRRNFIQFQRLCDCYSFAITCFCFTTLRLPRPRFAQPRNDMARQTNIVLHVIVPLAPHRPLPATQQLTPQSNFVKVYVYSVTQNFTNKFHLCIT